eukprot:TRINITY_DN6157_c0_g2_i1.p1 TRINITY_DN6157_c0_g2~~TRINITY_DN6157_c0_g2_i1.p1  ORF type:complete len:292 (+),score=95.99 TRINITY_DN6157_c0_g2_i1:161-1036(+)
MENLQPHPPPRERDRQYHKKTEKKGLLGEMIDKDAVYEFFLLSPEERERQRFETKRHYLDQTLGGRYLPDSANETARRIGTWQEVAAAKSRGMSKWELRKTKSRQALEAADGDAHAPTGTPAPTPASTPQPGRGSPTRRGKHPEPEREPYKMLTAAAEFGYDGHPYIQLGGKLEGLVRDSRATKGKPARTGDPLRSPTPPAAPEPAPRRASTAPALPPAAATPPPAAASPAPAPPPPPALPEATVDFSLAGLSYTELHKVMEAMDVLQGHFPDSRYLAPLHDVLLKAAASK